MKKRTAFETALVRRAPKKGDYLRYISYEMTLEALRKKRAHRLSMPLHYSNQPFSHLILSSEELPPGPPSVSDFALVKRQFHIFERALKKFKSDVALWIEYIHLAKKEGARSLVGRISARFVRTAPPSWILYSTLRHIQGSSTSPQYPCTLHSCCGP